MTRKTVRTDKSLLGRWWWSVDRWTLAALLALIVTGIVLVSAASPAVAETIGLPPFYFVYRHLAFVAVSVMVMLGMSMAGRKTAWRVSSLVFVGAAVLMVFAIFFGPEIKGATRWVHLFGFSLQPSEFIKPSFAVVAAWLIARQREERNFPGHQITLGLFAVAAGLMLLQPDFGMTFVLVCIWGAQVFLSGLSLVWVALLGLLGVAGIVSAYLVFPHVASRIDRFLDPASGDNYQVQKSLEAFSNGGLLGTGPAHGRVKLTLPDAHADFIFAVAGEEFGLIAALLLVSIFGFIIVRSILRVMHSDDMFALLAVGGLLTQFALQSLIHMGSSLQLLPAKGMTLPFISYGGSSMLALGFATGLLLALTRKRVNGAQAPLKGNRMQESYG